MSLLAASVNKPCTCSKLITNNYLNVINFNTFNILISHPVCPRHPSSIRRFRMNPLDGSVHLPFYILLLLLLPPLILLSGVPLPFYILVVVVVPLPTNVPSLHTTTTTTTSENDVILQLCDVLRFMQLVLQTVCTCGLRKLRAGPT
jgi:hypothetical protein